MTAAREGAAQIGAAQEGAAQEGAAQEGTMTPKQRTTRRQRSLTESLLSIVLALEAFVVFFAALVAFGLDLLAPALALGGGLALVVVYFLAGGMLRFPWGIGLAWALQAVLVATGLILPAMYVVGVGFLALFIFCFVRGRQIDNQKAAFLIAAGSTTPAAPAASPNQGELS